MKLIPALLALILFFFFAPPAPAQPQSVPFDAAHWEIRARESRLEDHLGRPSLYLKGGLAAVKDSHFTDGIIEFDIAFSPERGFMGAVWRMQDFANFEEFYLRPHQSGNPDANQYQPVFNGSAAWQLYYGEAYSAPIRYEFNRWMRVKIVVSGKNAEIYIRDMQTPALSVELKREIHPGRVGLSNGNFATAYFSNFRFTPLDRPALKATPKPAPPAPAGAVMSWLVSNPISGKSLETKYELTPAGSQSLTWTRLASESTGIANLARLHPLDDDKDTVFARLTILSDRDQIKKIQFGFSDSVRAYLNARLLYSGSDAYQSRDYRFLGTIGLYDALYLPLHKGENELWFAVSENFGGWGLTASFDDMLGIRLSP